MKKICFLLCICFSSNLAGQPYSPIVNSDHAWSVDVIDGFMGWIISNQITLGTEVVIDGKSYYEVIDDGTHQGCYIREENGQLIVYDGVEDKVILDMNLEIGDTFTPVAHCLMFSGSSTGADLEVVNVYTELIAEENRKVIEVLEPVLGLTEYWIEGIGSTSAIGVGIYDFDNRTELVCFHKNGNTYYFNEATSCENTMSIPDYLRQRIVLAPNPIIDNASLQWPLNLGIDKIRIYDIYGRLILEELTNGDHHNISRSHLSSGLYFYQVLGEGLVLKTERFLIK